MPAEFETPDLELATYRSVSLVTVCADGCQTPESLLVSSPELAHLRTFYFALYKCTHYYYHYYYNALHHWTLWLVHVMTACHVFWCCTTRPCR